MRLTPKQAIAKWFPIIFAAKLFKAVGRLRYRNKCSDLVQVVLRSYKASLIYQGILGLLKSVRRIQRFYKRVRRFRREVEKALEKRWIDAEHALLESNRRKAIKLITSPQAMSPQLIIDRVRAQVIYSRIKEFENLPPELQIAMKSLSPLQKPQFPPPPEIPAALLPVHSSVRQQNLHTLCVSLRLQANIRLRNLRNQKELDLLVSPIAPFKLESMKLENLAQTLSKINLELSPRTETGRRDAFLRSFVARNVIPPLILPKVVESISPLSPKTLEENKREENEQIEKIESWRTHVSKKFGLPSHLYINDFQENTSSSADPDDQEKESDENALANTTELSFEDSKKVVQLTGKQKSNSDHVHMPRLLSQADISPSKAVLVRPASRSATPESFMFNNSPSMKSSALKLPLRNPLGGSGGDSSSGGMAKGSSVPKDIKSGGRKKKFENSLAIKVLTDSINNDDKLSSISAENTNSYNTKKVNQPMPRSPTGSLNPRHSEVSAYVNSEAQKLKLMRRRTILSQSSPGSVSIQFGEKILSSRVTEWYDEQGKKMFTVDLPLEDFEVIQTLKRRLTPSLWDPIIFAIMSGKVNNKSSGNSYGSSSLSSTSSSPLKPSPAKRNRNGNSNSSNQLNAAEDFMFKLNSTAAADNNKLIIDEEFQRLMASRIKQLEAENNPTVISAPIAPWSKLPFPSGEGITVDQPTHVLNTFENSNENSVIPNSQAPVIFVNGSANKSWSKSKKEHSLSPVVFIPKHTLSLFDGPKKEPILTTQAVEDELILFVYSKNGIVSEEELLKQQRILEKKYVWDNVIHQSTYFWQCPDSVMIKSVETAREAIAELEIISLKQHANPVVTLKKENLGSPSPLSPSIFSSNTVHS
eukprot:GDKJ01036342.1.p1 GENE.GDKJ01036342.1~~GDKJ01036342.1.p1  ORF type:complete len:903 (-),score=181.29 GDKJ01036342.1:146-2758(-)